MLSSWKDDNDQTLTTWKAKQDATLSILVRDVMNSKRNATRFRKQILT